MMNSTSDNRRSLRVKTFLKLTVLVASQWFSLFILYGGMMWIDLPCKETYNICSTRSFNMLAGGLMSKTIFHTYLAF